MNPSYKPNDPNHQPMTDQALLAELNQVQSAFTHAKSASTEALSRLYIAYLHMGAASAPQENREWLARQIAAHNEEVDQEAEEQISSNSKGQTKRKRVKIHITHEPKRDLLAFVKFGAGLTYAGDESHASRVSRALEWVIKHFQGKEVRTADEVVDAVKRYGGFEAVIRLARTGDPKPNAKLEAAVARAVQKQVMQHATHAAAALVADLPSGSKLPDGVYVALVRPAQGKLELLSHRELKPEKDGPLLSAFRSSFLPAPPGAAALLRRTMTLSSIVPEGALTMLNEGDGWTTAPLCEERALILRAGSNGASEIIISARHVDAGPVISIRPSAACDSLATSPAGCLIMTTDARKELERLFAVSDVEHVLAVGAELPVDGTIADDRMVWRASSEYELKAPDTKQIDFNWEPISANAYRPLEVVGFNSTVTASATGADIKTLQTSVVDPAWISSQGAKEGAKPVAVRVVSDGHHVHIAASASMDVKLPVAKGTGSRVQLLVRLMDLKAATDALVRLGVTEAQVSADSGGILAITWSDSLASYSVFLPAMSTTGGLLTARFQQIEAIEPAAPAAA